MENENILFKDANIIDNNGDLELLTVNQVEAVIAFS